MYYSACTCIHQSLCAAGARSKCRRLLPCVSARNEQNNRLDRCYRHDNRLLRLVRRTLQRGRKMAAHRHRNTKVLVGRGPQSSRTAHSFLFHAQCAPITVRVVRGFIEQPCDARDKLDRAVAEIANVSVCALTVVMSLYVIFTSSMVYAGFESGCRGCA